MYVSPQSLPRTIEIGVSTTLTLDVYPEDSATLTAASAATVTVYQGQAVLVNAAVATVGGAYTASYALSGSVTTGLTPSDDYLEVWSITVGGAVHTFQRAGYLVRRAFHPSVTDAALTDYHSDLANLRPSTLTTYEPYRRRPGTGSSAACLSKGAAPGWYSMRGRWKCRTFTRRCPSSLPTSSRQLAMVATQSWLQATKPAPRLSLPRCNSATTSPRRAPFERATVNPALQHRSF